ncbi:bifunctional metallophosphatase/5'-nucleotidase [Agrococcus jejuensis]|uniref:2',3'-cyclic-nucleotide 2'-phosphodiesterase / 3'-nucleotidase n=1 Tax=Agrococcus jejuensis TaxID=399736 RepID=A0A1G8AF51_9MICO|nr:5'-nucleotidase C-terminal domain-containing protein [Agrococcus jejuensis]SDH19513.1 2',3'-cyclic-nucleotide 2'-phosphodiesterase / 3'-nucleotidase [Agrococcus jejuensis]
MPARRRVAATAALATAALLAAPAAAVAAPPPGGVTLTLMATTDIHGHLQDWDYFQNAAYPTEDALGVARIGTAIDEVRAEQGEESVVVLDNGDAIQGTPLTYLYGYGDERDAVLADEVDHPMAQAFDAIGLDAGTVGNHEFNYGLDLLEAYEDDLTAPLLGANVVDVASGQPALDPYTVIERVIDGQTVRVGVLGLVTPGVRVWDRQHVEGVLEFQDMVTAAQEWVPQVAAESDVVVVLAHTGQGTVEDAAYDPSTLPEDVAGNIARMVPGIDVLVAGHSHQDLPETVVTNAAGEQVLITQPAYWGTSASEVTLELAPTAEGFEVSWDEGFAPVVTPHYGRDIPVESQTVLDAIGDEHQAAVDYVNTPVAESVEELPAATSRYEDTAIIDFINQIQLDTVDAALDGTEWADTTVISQASPFSRTARFPQGQVTIRDIAGLYIYENTLTGVELTGAQLRDYLEYSARYFVQTEVGATFDPATGTNAAYPDRPEGVPDYNYDVISGLDYVIDVSQPVGSRIVGLAHPDGTPIADDETFVMAVNNYRQSGGGAFPHVAAAPVVYDDRLEIRQLLIDRASAAGTIDPADFFVENWSLTTDAQVEPTDPPVDPEPTTPAPSDPAPTSPAPTDGVGDDVAPGAGSQGSLPQTGAEGPTAALIAVALALLVGGALLARRRVLRG